MATKTSMTWEEFLAAGKEGQRWECVDGKVVFMAPVLIPHCKTNIQLDYELVAYTRLHPEWVGCGTDTAFTMASGNWRCPDASLVRKERVDTADPQGATPFAPDIAFEILSPNDTGSEMQSKRQDYCESKVIQVWLDPQRKTAEVIAPNRPAQHFRADQVLALPELPDLRLDLSSLFA